MDWRIFWPFLSIHKNKAGGSHVGNQIRVALKNDRKFGHNGRDLWKKFIDGCENVCIWFFRLQGSSLMSVFLFSRYGRQAKGARRTPKSTMIWGLIEALLYFYDSYKFLGHACDCTLFIIRNKVWLNFLLFFRSY